MDALAALKGIRRVFYDGETILLPEYTFLKHEVSLN